MIESGEVGTIEHKTDRLHLRPFCALDARAMTKVFSDPEVMRFGDGPQNLTWIRAWIECQVVSDRREPGHGLWAVVEKCSNTVMGYCGFFKFPDICGQPEVEIGYRLGRAHWGRGYATEAAIAVRDHGFKALGFARLVSLIDPNNSASIRVAEKVGMVFEKEVMLEGYTHPDHLYVVLAQG